MPTPISRPGRARRHPTVGAAAATVVAAALAQTGPALLRSAVLRDRVAPRLAGRSDQQHVALTFDDGPDPVGTTAILAALDSLNVKGTFFVLGSQLSRHHAVAEEVVAAGHEIGIHGLDHRNALRGAPWAAAGRLRVACEAVTRTTGVVPRWYRPPYGVLTGGVLTAAARLGLRPVLWTAWGRDWEDRTPESVTAAVLRDLRPGGTVLLHDSDCTTPVRESWRVTVAALPGIVEAAVAMGCRVGPLSEHWAT